MSRMIAIPRPRRRIPRAASVVLLLLGSGACASTPVGSDGVDPRVRSRSALVALSSESFAEARTALLALGADCTAGSFGRDALLLLAAAELDTGNPEGSPTLATHLAGAYLRLPGADPREIPVARALYRLAADLHEADLPDDFADELPPVAPRFDQCDTGPTNEGPATLPTTPRRWTTHITALRDLLAEQGDSLAVARSTLDRQAEEIVELRAEIERITELLKSGTPGRQPRQRR